MNKTQKHRVERLERRADYLERRDGGDYDRAEASAIRWALTVIREADAEGTLDGLGMEDEEGEDET